MFAEIKKFFSFRYFLLFLFSFLSIVSLTYAATTLGNHISTTGTITSQGKAYLVGGVSTPVLNATSSLIDNLSVNNLRATSTLDYWLANAPTTDNLREGTKNLYYTDQRVANYVNNNSFLTVSTTNLIAQNALLSQATIPTLNSTSSLIDNLNVKVNLAVQGLTQLATTTSFNINKVVIVDGKHYPANSTGIQEAIDSLGPEGGKVFLPAGTYPITTTTTLPSNVWLQGAGASSTILYLANNANTTILTNSDPVNGNSHIKISDLMVYGNKINNTHSDNNGVLFINVTNSEVVDARVKDCHNAGISVNSSSNNVIERSEIEGDSTGIYFYSGNNNVIDKNEIKKNNYGIYFNSSSYNSIINNDVEGNYINGIYLYGSKILVKGNFIKDNGIGWFSLARGGISLPQWSSNNIIINNQIIGNMANGIIIEKSSNNNVISQNNISSSYWDNIYLEVDNYNIISQNQISSSLHYGIEASYSNYVTIIGNTFFGIGTDLKIGSTNHHILLTGNHFSDAVVDDSPDTIYSSQPLNNDNIILKSIGNVGIGTTNPLTRLSVLKADTASSSLTTLLSLSHTASGGYGHPGIGSGLSFINQSTLGDSTTTAEIASIYNASSTAPEGNLTFFTKNSLLPPQERMVITSQGNVGIGTTTPSQALSVAGNIYASGTVVSTNMNLTKVEFTPAPTPTSPKIGDCFMDNGAKPQINCYDGANWHPLW